MKQVTKPERKPTNLSSECDLPSLPVNGGGEVLCKGHHASFFDLIGFSKNLLRRPEFENLPYQLLLLFQHLLF